MLEDEGLRLGGLGKEDVMGEAVAGEFAAGDVPLEVAAGEEPGLCRVLMTGIEGSGAAGGTLREGLEGRGKEAMSADQEAARKDLQKEALRNCKRRSSKRRVGRPKECKGDPKLRMHRSETL